MIFDGIIFFWSDGLMMMFVFFFIVLWVVWIVLCGFLWFEV